MRRGSSITREVMASAQRAPLPAGPRDFSIWQPLRADRGRRDASRSAPMRIWRRRTNTVVIRTQRVAFTVTQGNVPLAFPFDLSEEYRTANDGDLA